MILQRYLYREVLLAFGSVFVLLTMIFVSRMLVEYLKDAASGTLAADAIVKLLGLLVLTSLVLLIPLCFFMGIILAMGRMQRDGELIAMHAGGLGSAYLQKSMLRLTLVFTIGVTVLAFFANPWATRLLKQVKARAEQESDITGIAAGRFKEFSEGDRVLFAKELSPDKQEMRDVFLQSREKGKLGVLAADSAGMATEAGTGNRFVVFAAGRRYVGVPGQADYQVTEYQKLGVRIDRGQKDYAVSSTRALPNGELWGSDNPLYEAELQWRFSFPITTVLLGLFGVTLARTASRQNRYGVVVVAILVYATYNNTQGIATSLLKKGEVPVYVGVWWVHLLMLGVWLAIEGYPMWTRWRRQRDSLQQLIRPG